MNKNINFKEIYIFFVTVLLLLMSCSAHNPFIAKNTTQTENVSKNKYPPHTNKVFITSESLPTTANFEILTSIEVGKVWYGSSKNISTSMAMRAREIGADAVIEVETWRQPSGWSWAAPHGSGKAIKILDPASIDLSKLQGEWY